MKSRAYFFHSQLFNGGNVDGGQKWATRNGRRIPEGYGRGGDTGAQIDRYGYKTIYCTVDRLVHRISTARKEKGRGRLFFPQIEPN